MLDVDLESGTEIFNVADDPTSPPLLSPLPLCRDSCGQFRSVISDKNESKKRSWNRPGTEAKSPWRVRKRIRTSGAYGTRRPRRS